VGGTKAGDDAAQATERRGEVGEGAGRDVGGRPTLLTQELGDEILERIALGEAVRQICLLPGMPNETTFYRWLLRNEEFRAQYRIAKEAQMDRMEEALVEIADDARNDWMTRESERGGERLAFNDEAVRRSTLRINVRQWLMSKLKSKKYGDKVEVTGEGAKTEITVNVGLSKDRLDELQQRRLQAMEDQRN